MQLAAKEAVYLRDLQTGVVRTVEGPLALLPDPTQVERVNRPLDPELIERWGLTKFDPSRAPTVMIPPGEAVLVTGTQTREVVRGPMVRVLAFDETLETLTLSTGTPKRDEVLLSTCFLRVEGNKVSDVVRVRTADHVELEVRLSYRVSFMHEDGVDDARWFSVPNYVGLLCDHLGSLVRAAVRQTPIERFHAASAEVLRTAVLGEKKGERRTGREFEGVGGARDLGRAARDARRGDRARARAAGTAAGEGGGQGRGGARRLRVEGAGRSRGARGDLHR